MKFISVIAGVGLASLVLVDAVPIFKRQTNATALANSSDPYSVVYDYSDPAIAFSQFRLAFNGPTGITVSWSTPSKSERPTVYYGESPFNLNNQAFGDSITYDTSVTWDNHVSIGNLQPSTKYYYRVGEQPSSFNPQEEDFYFITAKEVADHSEYSIAIFADLGFTVGDIFSPGTVASRISPTFNSLLQNRDSIDFLWHAGDFGYADNWLQMEQTEIYANVSGTFAYNNIMNSFYDQFTPVTKNTIHMVGPGNHDASCIENADAVSLCPDVPNQWGAWRTHYAMPTVDQTENYFPDMWYSWDYGMAHFVQINTETDMLDENNEDNWGGLNPDFAPNNTQLAWLEADLAAVDRSKTPWIIVAGHRPWYNSQYAWTDVGAAFESIVAKYGVDLYWAGHAHMYERDTPVFNNKLDPNGLNNPTFPWYITSGAAGNIEGNSINPPDENPNYTVFTGAAYGWTKLTFHNSTHLTEQFIDSDTGVILDQATIYKDHASKR